MKLEIPGIPNTKLRPRMGKNGVVYDQQYKEKAFTKLLLKNALKMAQNGSDGKVASEAKSLKSSQAFAIDLVFCMPVNESDSIANVNLKIWNLVPCNKKPDIDNLEKFILDCANKILFDDDHMIIKLSSKKIYSNQPKTEINIMALPEKTFINQESSLEVFKLYTPGQLRELLNDFRQVNYTFPEFFDSLNDSDKYECMSIAANLICRFADKHAMKIRKIKSVKDKKSMF